MKNNDIDALTKKSKYFFSSSVKRFHLPLVLRKTFNKNLKTRLNESENPSFDPTIGK